MRGGHLVWQLRHQSPIVGGWIRGLALAPDSRFLLTNTWEAAGDDFNSLLLSSHAGFSTWLLVLMQPANDSIVGF